MKTCVCNLFFNFLDRKGTLRPSKYNLVNLLLFVPLAFLSSLMVQWRHLDHLPLHVQNVIEDHLKQLLHSWRCNPATVNGFSCWSHWPVLLDIIPNLNRRLLPKGQDFFWVSWQKQISLKIVILALLHMLLIVCRSAVSIPVAYFLKTCDICEMVLCEQTTHFTVACYCIQPKAHLCNNHAV